MRHVKTPAKFYGRPQLQRMKCWRNAISMDGASVGIAGTPGGSVVSSKTGEQCAACPVMRVAHGGAERR